MMNELKAKIKDKNANIGIIGLGYVGLPLAAEFAKASMGESSIEDDVVTELNRGDKKNPWDSSLAAFIEGATASDNGSVYISTTDLSSVSSGGSVTVTVKDPTDGCGWSGNELTRTITRE